MSQQYRVVWEYDPCPDLSYLEQWDTPEKYYDVKPVCPKCGGSMTYEGGHLFRCDGGDDCIGSCNADENAGEANGVVLKDGNPVPFEEYIQFWGNAARHHVLCCRVEKLCPYCCSWSTVESVCSVGFMDVDMLGIGTYNESELEASDLHDYQLEVSLELLEEAKAAMED